ncbi:MAG: hypothetical protein AAF667_01360 [Pseudomonadota bacterium]
MIQRAGIEAVRDIQSGHVPYLTQPEALAAILVDLAELMPASPL